MNSNIKFEKVIPTDKQIKQLYLFLKEREYSISHVKIPSKIEHTSFVINHPYIAWYLVFKEDNEKLISSTYLKDDNTIGINLISGYENYFTKIVDFIKMNHKPLPAIKSVRRKNFTVSISSGNSKLIELLHSQNNFEISYTFSV